MRMFERKPEKVLILGSGLSAQRIARVAENDGVRYIVAGFVDDQAGRNDRDRSLGSRILGPLAELRNIVDRVAPHRIVIALTERRGHLPVRECLGFRMEGIVVEDWAEFYERVTGKVAIENLNPSSLLFSKVFEKHYLRRFLHRSFDIVYASAAFLLAGPLMAMIAIAIKLDSTGPVLFVQRRMGYRGRPFDLLKFRTMAHGAGRTSEWVRDNDGSVTRVGRVLRKYRLDEIPQFINILVGQMALIGPRPHPQTNAGLFSDAIPYYLIRSTVRPGVTGWAQVRLGYANDLREEIEKMRYDLYYIKHQSVLFDLRILFETVWIVLFGRGSDCATGRADDESAWARAQSPVPAPVFDREPRASRPWHHTIVDPSDLSFYSPSEQRIIAAEIRGQLGCEPLVETRNRRRLYGSSLAAWELRADKYRIFYEADEESHQVTVVAVGHRQGARLFVRGEEVVL